MAQKDEPGHIEPEGQHDVGTDPQPDVIRFQIVMVSQT